MTVELPKDAEGREIPLDTALLYGEVSGDEYEVVCFNFRPSMRRWMVKLKRRDDVGIYATENFTLSQPDSWEKLEEDLQRIDTGGSGWFCMYAGYDKDDDSCHSECKFFEDKTPCDRQAARDIVSRIRKLRGED